MKDIIDYRRQLMESKLSVTSVTSTKPVPVQKKVSKLRYYIRVIRWLVKHRAEKNCRQKWRRMERDMGGTS